MHKLFSILILICCSVGAHAQMKQIVSAGPLIPVSTFSNSHSAGMGLSYSRYISFSKSDSVRSAIQVALAGGADYYFGKNKTTAGYPFKYPGLTHFSLMAGLRYRPVDAAFFSLAAGPVLSLYEGVSTGLFGANFNFDYLFTQRITAGPGLYYRKAQNADALWALTIRASYAF